MKLEILEQVTCRGCETIIGPLIRVKGRVAIFRDGFTVFDGFFRCGLCLRVFYFEGAKYNFGKECQNGKSREKVERMA